ncbi:MAG: NAD-binding protein, partial [Alphaproteobacteria bacterium]
SPTSSVIDGQHKVVIAGFGRVGQMVADVMEAQRIPYIAFDHDGKRVQQLTKQNFNVIYGDARQKQFWSHLIDDHIEVAVIAIDDHHATKPILKSLRAHFPLLPVIVRSKNNEDLNVLYDEGASEVVAETMESSLRIAELLMKTLGSPADEIKGTTEKIRAQNIY